MFLIGIAGFTLASLWCGLAVDPVMLIAGRLVQGGFGALLIPQGIGILIDTFSREQLPRAFSRVRSGAWRLGRARARSSRASSSAPTSRA